MDTYIHFGSETIYVLNSLPLYHSRKAQFCNKKTIIQKKKKVAKCKNGNKHKNSIFEIRIKIIFVHLLILCIIYNHELPTRRPSPFRSQKAMIFSTQCLRTFTFTRLPISFYSLYRCFRNFCYRFRTPTSVSSSLRLTSRRSTLPFRKCEAVSCGTMVGYHYSMSLFIHQEVAR